MNSISALVFIVCGFVVLKFSSSAQFPRFRETSKASEGSSSYLVPLAALALVAIASRLRRKTRTVMVGEVPVGSEHPLALQSMTTTPTADVKATALQAQKCKDAGIDIVRVTVQGMKEAKACVALKASLKDVPIVADIHFTPKVALVAADSVDKVRINPGNFADGAKTFNKLNGQMSDDDVMRAKQSIFNQLKPLVATLKLQGKSMRIGVNHGSLSERILVQYGDTPAGMVASAMEVAEMCHQLDYYSLIFSMKSSNPRVMVHAYRMLAHELDSRGWHYPLHLGVTEAGSGIDGRLKSAVGIGTLLLDGIGDTIRVSLTEDPWLEAPACQALKRVHAFAMSSEEPREPLDSPFTFEPRNTRVPSNANFIYKDGTVVISLSVEQLRLNRHDTLVETIGLEIGPNGYVKGQQTVDAVLVNEWQLELEEVERLGIEVIVLTGFNRGFPLISMNASVPYKPSFARLLDGSETSMPDDASVAFYVLKPSGDFVNAGRRISKLLRHSDKALIVWFEEAKYQMDDHETCLAMGGSYIGSLLVDGLAQGIIWETEDARVKSFTLLQAARMRSTKTEFISCPSCGRTLFDIQATTERIRKKTGHIPGLRIAVMGCIVNGPGEMADADFGYVGSLPGKVDLYVGKECVKRSVPEGDADKVLIDLIREHGRWLDS